MDYTYISPDLQYKGPAGNAFTESLEIDMNIPKCRNQEDVCYQEYKTIIFTY